MDFQEAIIDFLGIQDVEIEAINFHKKAVKSGLLRGKRDRNVSAPAVVCSLIRSRSGRKRKSKRPQWGSILMLRFYFIKCGVIVTPAIEAGLLGPAGSIQSLNQ
jgi:hypothetical protein